MDKLKRQPKGLYVLFCTELCDRFTYYGIQSLLVLYLTKSLHNSDASAYALFGVYSALAFSLPMLGGFFSDKCLGYARSILYGLSLVLLSTLFLVVTNTVYLYIGFGLIICGIGLFKASNASLLGTLYSEHDIKRESGFTIFYMGMNTGAILGPICYGIVAVKWGWNAAFILGGIVTLISLIIFITNLNLYLTQKTHWQISKIFTKIDALLVLCIFLVLIVVTLLLQFSYYFGDLLTLVSILTFIALFFICKSQNSSARRNIILLIILDIFSIFFFACSLQISSSLLLFVNRHIHANIFGYKIPTEFFASLEPFFVIITAPLFSPLWTYLENKHQAPSVIGRVIFGLLLGAISFWIFDFSAKLAFAQSTVWSLFGVVFGNLILGAGELCIGPALISAVTYLVPKKLQATFMGLWYLSIAFAAYLSSIFAKLSASPIAKSLLEGDIAYYHAFEKTAIVTSIAGIIAIMSFPFLKRLQYIAAGSHK